jgi:hypothetical protein
MIPATGSRGILQENTGNRWNMEAVFWPEIVRFFLVDSYQLPVLSDRNRTEIIGKNPKKFRPEYCFHKNTGITRNRPFPGRTLRPWVITQTKLLFDADRNEKIIHAILSVYDGGFMIFFC